MVLSGVERASGYNWLEAKDICRRENLTLPLTTSWMPAYQRQSCYLRIFQSISSSLGKNIHFWSGACDARLQSCGRFVSIVNFPHLSKYDQAIDTTLKHLFTNVACFQGKLVVTILCVPSQFTPLLSNFTMINQ